jgi:hypothetical protein
VKLAGDPETIARDEDAVEDGGPALGIERDALRLERRHAGATSEVARLAPSEPDRGHGLARPLDRDAELELEGLAKRSAIEIGLEQLLAEARRQERVLQAHRPSADEPEPFDHEHARAWTQAEGPGDVTVGDREPRAEEPRGHGLALGEQLAGEPAQLEDVVIDRRGGHEGAETVTTDDQVLALEHLERLAQGHQRDAEGLRELALVRQRRAGRELSRADLPAQRFGDPVIPRTPSDHLATFTSS